ncbi:hypothetical protein WEI85_03000 [Actinomycetes bacterium KLBMP 9797]
MRRLTIVGSGLLLAAALAAGCGGAAADEGVATVAGAQASPTASGSPGANDPEQGRKFAQCMRENGVPDFPDPGPDGGFDPGQFGGGNIDRTKMRGALEACQDLAPNGGERRELNPAQQEQLRQWAQCMRDNGVDVPDPDPNGGGLFGNGGQQFDRDDPAFQKAMDACRDKMNSFREGAGA